MLVTCQGPDCDVEFEARRPNAKWHSDRCRKAARRKADRIAGEPPAASTPKSNDGSGKDSELVAAVRKELADADRLGTVEAQTALLLAKRASEAGVSGVSALVKEMRVAIDEALDGAVLDIVCVHCGKQAMKPDVDDEVSKARKARERKAREAATR